MAAPRLRLPLKYRPNSINIIILGLISLIIVSEVHSILGYFFKEEMLQDASDWFFNPLPEGYITVGWWLYEVEGLFAKVLSWCLVAYLAKRYSNKLYVASIIFLMHPVFSAVMFLVYYKKPVELFWTVLVIVVALFSTLFIKEKKQAVIKSIK